MFPLFVFIVKARDDSRVGFHLLILVYNTLVFLSRILYTVDTLVRDDTVVPLPAGREHNYLTFLVEPAGVEPAMH